MSITRAWVGGARLCWILIAIVAHFSPASQPASQQANVIGKALLHDSWGRILRSKCLDCVHACMQAITMVCCDIKLKHNLSIYVGLRVSSATSQRLLFTCMHIRVYAHLSETFWHTHAHQFQRLDAKKENTKQGHHVRTYACTIALSRCVPNTDTHTHLTISICVCVL